MEEKIENTVLNEEVMMERGVFVANGHTFHVKPIYLGETDAYLTEMTISPIFRSDDDHEPTDKELGMWSITLFSKQLNANETPKRSKFLTFLSNLIHRHNYRYYDDYPAIQPLVKWLEKKVTCNGEKVRFYDLERKYGLNKAEIEKLFAFFHEISGF